MSLNPLNPPIIDLQEELKRFSGIINSELCQKKGISQKELCLALRIKNGILSPPNAPKVWSKQIERIDRFYEQHSDLQYPIGKQKLKETLDKIEKFKKKRLENIFRLKHQEENASHAFNSAINTLTPKVAEIIRHLIDQPFPEKPIPETPTGLGSYQNKFNHSEKISCFILSLLNKIAAICICAGLIRGKKSVQQEKIDFRDIFFENSMAKNYEIQPIEITTPDGVKIRGTYFKNKNTPVGSERQIVINCNCSGGLFMTTPWLLAPDLANFNYDVISFDYRGCADSDGFPTSSENLYLDTDTVYQFVKNRLQIPPANIHFFGHSLGGCVALNVKAAHPECTGRIVIDRSFSHLKYVIENLCADLFAGIFPAFFLLAPPQILAFIFTKLVSILNWDMESEDPLNNAKGASLVVFHDRDSLMREYANLDWVSDAPVPLPLTNCTVKNGEIHSADLNDFIMPQSGIRAVWRVAKFLFNFKPPTDKASSTEQPTESPS